MNHITLSLRLTYNYTWIIRLVSIFCRFSCSMNNWFNIYDCQPCCIGIILHTQYICVHAALSLFLLSLHPISTHCVFSPPSRQIICIYFFILPRSCFLVAVAGVFCCFFFFSSPSTFPLCFSSQLKEHPRDKEKHELKQHHRWLLHLTQFISEMITLASTVVLIDFCLLMNLCEKAINVF